MRILFVENHRVFAEIVADRFLYDLIVEQVSTLADAKRSLRHCSFDCVLLDYDLDDGKGDEVLHWLRARGTSVRVIAISGRPEGNAALVRAGADEVCPKGDFSQLRAQLGLG
ncbi:MAG: response regulator [Myxococcota bacterium]